VTGGRYVVLALSRARSEWLGAVAHWTTAGSIPVELVKCLSGEDLQARLSSGRPCSAAIVDAGVPALDRDLVDLAGTRGCVVVVVENRRFSRDWLGLGAVATLPERFTPQQLLDALGGRAAMIGRPDHLPGSATGPDRLTAGGRVAVVCGPGGTGASTLAIALSQGLAHRQSSSVTSTTRGGANRVLLADLALHADQAMLHDARDVVPGVQELVEAYRAASPPADDLRSLVFAVEERGYDLLLGLRRARGWVALRPRSVEAAFDGIRGAWSLLVCDTDAELEGEAETGSVDVEERHALARTAVAQADVVFAVGVPGVKGAHSLVRVLGDLVDFGVPPQRVVPVVNRAPRGHRARAEVAQVCAVVPARPGPGAPASRGPEPDGLCPPVFLPERRVDDALRDGVALPPSLSSPLVAAFDGVLHRLGPRHAGAERGPEPARVVPGSLGHWEDEVDPGPRGESGPAPDAAWG